METPMAAKSATPSIQRRFSSVRDLLEQNCEAKDREQLGSMLEAILDIRSAKEELEQLLQARCHEWLGPAALAVLIEASVRVKVKSSGIEEAIVAILRSPDPPPQAAAVAAQRLRTVHVADLGLRKELSQRLRALIDRWRAEPRWAGYAFFALPSVPFLYPDDSAGWTAQLIAQENARLAEAAAWGILGWATGASRSRTFDDLVAGKFAQAMIARFERETRNECDEPELVAALVWVLGATATSAQLERAAKIVATSFQRQDWGADDAAVMAGRLLYRRLGSLAQVLIGEDLGGRGSDVYMAFERALAAEPLVR
jgi:hypothetical protein